jgi:hypothetical protein
VLILRVDRAADAIAAIRAAGKEMIPSSAFA